MATTSPQVAGPVVEGSRATTGALLVVVGREAQRHLRDSLTAHRLKPRQLQILDLLAECGPVGQRDLGAAIEIDHSILVTLLNPLEADGLIRRERDAADRRRHVVTLTAAGRLRLAGAADARREAEDTLLSGLTEQQRAQLRALLVALQDANKAGRGSTASPDAP
jgi:DNA-binding MarR family transcriptional regulator